MASGSLIVLVSILVLVITEKLFLFSAYEIWDKNMTKTYNIEKERERLQWEDWLLMAILFSK